MRIFFLFIIISAQYNCTPIIGPDRQETEEDKLWHFWSVDWHPTQDLIALGGSNNTQLKLLSTSKLQETRSIHYPGTITQTKWHPSKNLLAISVQDGKSKSSIFNIETGELKELDSLPSSGARALGWNHSGSLLAVGDNEGYITIFNNQGGYLKSINTNQKGLMSLDWHPKENIIVAVGENITIYNYSNDVMEHFRSREESVLTLCVAWHPSGELFVTGDYGDIQNQNAPLLQYWTSDGKKIRSIERSKAEYRNIAWSSDGELLATASEKIRTWDKEGKLIREKAVKNLLWGLDWRDDKIVSTDDNKKIIFWNNNLDIIEELHY